MKILRKQNLESIFGRSRSTWLHSGLIFAQQIRVVATFPDLADITRQIGKELVNVESLATGVEDPHGVPVRPSFVPRLNRADVLVLTGLGTSIHGFRHFWRLRAIPKFCLADLAA